MLGRKRTGTTSSGKTRETVIQIDEYEVMVTRKNIKNAYLRVKSSGAKLEVNAPLTMTDAMITRFVLERQDWIEDARSKHLVKEKQMEEAPVMVPFQEREARGRLQRQIRGLILAYEPVMGVKTNGFTIRKMKTRWGSCNVKTGHMSFNFALAFVPEECLRYVVVHEMTHLLEPSHNARFWALMETYLPGSKQLRKQLNQFSTQV